ncbi:hypothetical protein WJX77_011945 [Trebouxia sp. C0004]
MPFSPNSPGYPLLSPRSAAPEAAPAYIPSQPAMMMCSPFALPAQTSFESERSHHNFPGLSAEDAAESDYSDEESDPEQDATPRRSSRKRNATQASREGDDQDWSKPKKKKVGRPITYNGDPNAPELTEAERRKVKRRIANRESARRVQQRRKEMIDELQHKLIYIQHHHHHLMQHLSKLELEKGQLQALMGASSNAAGGLIVVDSNIFFQMLHVQAQAKLQAIHGAAIICQNHGGRHAVCLTSTKTVFLCAWCHLASCIKHLILMPTPMWCGYVAAQHRNTGCRSTITASTVSQFALLAQEMH